MTKREQIEKISKQFGMPQDMVEIGLECAKVSRTETIKGLKPFLCHQSNCLVGLSGWWDSDKDKCSCGLAKALEE